MTKLARAIGGLEKEELLVAKKELEEGSLLDLVDRKLLDAYDENKVCPVCHEKIENAKYEFVFGPNDMKMKACFDALDCMQHFVEELKSQKSKSSSSFS